MALVTLLVAGSGCSMSRLAAKQIITAPNLRQPVPTNFITSWWTNFFPRGSSNPLVMLTIPVGTPEVKLHGFDLPPGDYHWKFDVHITTNGSDVKTMTLRFLRDTNSTFQALAHPATVILLHGYAMTKESMAPWGFVLAQAGYRVIALDLRGHGMSGGARVGFGKYETADLRQALDYLMAHGLCDERVGVLGMSYGATMALHWAAQDTRIRSVVAIAPYNQPEEAIVRFAEMEGLPIPKRILQAGMARVARTLELQWKDWSAEAAMRHVVQPVLIIGGGRDPICRSGDMAALAKAAGNGTRILVIPEANHFMIGAWLHRLSEPITAWFKEHPGAEAATSKGGGARSLKHRSGLQLLRSPARRSEPRGRRDSCGRERAEVERGPAAVGLGGRGPPGV